MVGLNQSEVGLFATVVVLNNEQRKLIIQKRWARFSKSRKLFEFFGLEKPFVKLRLAYCVKLVFLYVVKGLKIKITAKFRASRRLRFEDTKRIMAPEIRPKSFETFEKQATGRLLRG